MTDSPAIINGTFADFKLVKTRSQCQLVIEVPIEDADRALRALGGVPQPGAEKPVTVVRFQEQSDDARTARQSGDGDAPEPDASEAPRRQMSPAQVAGMLCSQMRFQRFLHEQHGVAFDHDDLEDRDIAAQAVREICATESRRSFNEQGTEPAGLWITLHADYEVWCRT